VVHGVPQCISLFAVSSLFIALLNASPPQLDSRLLCAKVCPLGLHYSVLTVNPYLPKQRKHLAPNGQFQATVQKHENQRISENTRPIIMKIYTCPTVGC